MKFLRDLEPHRYPHQQLWVWQAEAVQRRRFNTFLFLSNACFIRRDFELNAPPGDASEFEEDVESSRFDELVRYVDDLNFASAQHQWTPRLIEYIFKYSEERIHVPTDQTVDILGGSGRRVESMLQQGAALEEKQLATVFIKDTLESGDRN